MFRTAVASVSRPAFSLVRQQRLAQPSRAIASTSFLLKSGNKKATIAERPSAVPDSISDPADTVAKKSTSLPGTGEIFEPIVNDMRSDLGPHSVDSSSSVDPTSAPIGETTTSDPVPPVEPVSPAQIPEEPYQIPDQPDLTKLPSLDIGFDAPPVKAIDSPEGSETASGSGKTGAKSKPSLSSIEQRRQNFTRFLLASGLIGGAVGAYYLANKEDNGKTAGEEAVGAWERFKTNLADLLDIFNKPAFEQLLPPPLPAPHQRPYTLLIDLEDMLVHSAWDRQGGWRTAKRPGADYFLAYLSQFYEIVLFTSQPNYTAMPVAEKLDPFQAYLPYRLFRESTRYVKGKVVKDLSFLGRDLQKVVLLDTNPDHASLQPENAIIIPKWTGQPGDKGLVDMIPFLESIGIFSPPDIRPILKAYEGKDIPKEYAIREAERKQAAIAEWQRDHGTVSTGGQSWIGKAFSGLSGQPVARPTQPMTYLEQKRAQAQAVYLEEQEYWRKNADEIKRLIEDDKNRQLAEQKGSLMNWISGKPATPAETPAPASAPAPAK